MTGDYTLAYGTHANPEDGRCAMEWVSHLAGEPHSDQPRCVSPVLRALCIGLNDGLDDLPRQRLRPYLARTIGTADDGLDTARSWLAMDWLIRVYAPVWIEAAGRSGDRAPRAGTDPRRTQPARGAAGARPRATRGPQRAMRGADRAVGCGPHGRPRDRLGLRRRGRVGSRARGGRGHRRRPGPRHGPRRRCRRRHRRRAQGAVCRPADRWPGGRP